MLDFLGRAGLLICAVIIVFLARRLHSKASGKAEKTQKTIATVAVFFGGLAMLGTVAGDWMATVTKASPFIAAAAFILAAGGLFIDWWTDKKPDKFAFWCALALPLAIVFGLGQLSTLGEELQESGDRVQTTLDGGR